MTFSVILIVVYLFYLYEKVNWKNVIPRYLINKQRDYVIRRVVLLCIEQGIPLSEYYDAATGMIVGGTWSGNTYPWHTCYGDDK